MLSTDTLYLYVITLRGGKHQTSWYTRLVTLPYVAKDLNHAIFFVHVILICYCLSMSFWYWTRKKSCCREIGKCRETRSKYGNRSSVMRIWRQPSPVQIMVDKKQMETVEYISCLSSPITNDSKFVGEMKFRIDMTPAAFNSKKSLVTGGLCLNLTH